MGHRSCKGSRSLCATALAATATTDGLTLPVEQARQKGRLPGFGLGAMVGLWGEVEAQAGAPVPLFYEEVRLWDAK